MKKLFISIAAIYVLFFASSCSKDSDGIFSNQMSAKIGGTEWTALLPTGVFSNESFAITGTSLTGETIVITIKGDTTGTYNLSVLPVKTECLGTYKATVDATTEDTYVSTTGSVVLTKVDKSQKLISGTFSFYVANQAFAVKQITNGTFTNVTYISK